MTNGEAEVDAAPDVLEGQAQAQRIAAQLAGSVKLLTILVREIQWSVPDVVVPPGLPINLVPQLETKIGKAPDTLVYRIRSTVPGTIPDGTEIFRFTSVLDLVYTTPPGAQYSLEELQAFGSTSVALMAFPYIRELLQSTAARSGMPAIVLPTFTLPLVSTDQ